MNPMDTNHGGEAAGGINQPSQDTGFKQRRSDRRGEGGLFGGYDGPNDARAATVARRPECWVVLEKLPCDRDCAGCASDRVIQIRGVLVDEAQRHSA